MTRATIWRCVGLLTGGMSERLKFTARDALIVLATILALQLGDWVTGVDQRKASATYWAEQMQRMREEVDPKQGWRRMQSQTLREILLATAGPEAVIRFDKRMRLLGQPPLTDELADEAGER